MKKVILFAMLFIGLVACNNNQKSEESNEPVAENQVDTSNVPVYELDSLLAIADQSIDKTVKVRGYVTHTCKHSGKRCFITDNSQKASIRVEAKGNIGGFNLELTGSELEITGVFKERRLSKEYIDQMEKGVHAKAKEDGSVESCQAEMKNVEEMKAWMKEHGKEYYAIYYMDGLDYEVIE